MAAVNYGNNNLHALITFAELERVRKPGQDVQAKIDSTGELINLIIADLKEKYDPQPSTDVQALKNLLVDLDKEQDKVDPSQTSSGQPYLDNNTRNSIISRLRSIGLDALVIAAREGLFDKTSVPSGDAPEPEGVRRRRA